MFKLFKENKKITETLYEQNLELAVKNKTLSLLENLYETSVLTLLPQEMAGKITEIIRKDLNLELAGVLIFQKETDSLMPLAFSKSERLKSVLSKLGFLFSNITITDISNREFFKKVVYGKTSNTTNNLQEVWQELINQEHVKEIKKQSHIKTVLLYPLIKGNEVLGTLLLGFNRDYDTLNTFEKASIKSFINVIALLLDKAYLYKDLQDSYEVTKRAYEVEKQAKEKLGELNKKLEELDKDKDDFLSETQHDLKTPLSAIIGYSDLLASGMFGKLPKEAVDTIRKMEIMTQDKVKDINNFLDAKRIKDKGGIVSLNPGIELLPMLNEIMTIESLKVKTNKIYLKLEKPKKVFTVKADREKLKNALFNVIDNAVKFTKKGGVDIKLEDSGNNVRIVVSDTGIGIPVDKVKNMFEGQPERTQLAKKTAEGHGIGLALSAKVIKLHNGKVWAESLGEGEGSTFYIELPLG